MQKIPDSEENLKKIRAFILMFAFIFFLAGCGKERIVFEKKCSHIIAIIEESGTIFGYKIPYFKKRKAKLYDGEEVDGNRFYFIGMPYCYEKKLGS